MKHNPLNMNPMPRFPQDEPRLTPLQAPLQGARGRFRQLSGRLERPLAAAIREAAHEPWADALGMVKVVGSMLIEETSVIALSRRHHTLSALLGVWLNGT